MKRYFLSVFLLLAVVAAAAFEKKSVVVISPYKQSDAWSRTSLSPVTDLAALHPELEVSHYTLDVSVHDTPEKYNDFIEDVIGHTGGREPDLLILSGAQTYNILEDFNKVWPGIRIIIEGDTDYMCDREYVLALHPDRNASRVPLEDLRPDCNLTLIQAPVYFEETLDAMLQLKPKTSEVVFIGGQDFYSRECQLTMQKVVEDRGLAFTAVTPFDMSFEEFKALMRSKDMDRTSVLFKSCFVTEGRDYFRNDIENAMPVFFMHYMLHKGEHGGLGYVSYRFRTYEEAMQSVITKVLEGSAEPRDIPFTVIPCQAPVINVDCMVHYGIDRSRIPEGATLENIPPTFWEEYRDFIILSAVLVLIILLISFFLVYSRGRNRRLKRLSAELKDANRQLADAKEKAERSSALRSLYVQNMSHDVRTPINAIVGFSQLLGLPDGVLTEQEKEQYNKYISDNSDLLQLLVGDILDMSDLENNGYKVQMQDAPCNHICEVSMGCAGSRVKDGVRLYFTSEVDDDFTVRIDPRRAQQILVNYLTNACKHTDSGEIHLHCSTSEEPGKVVFSVTDTGHGVDPSKAKMIFERYTKLDAVEGHGIGLSICLVLAEKMGCEVRLDTSYTGGARFILSVPYPSHN